MENWWGRGLLIAVIAFFIYGLISAFLGFHVPPLERTGKHIRRESKHTSFFYHGYTVGGGTGVGK
ncbi:MAG: hypothetical protein LWY06_11140 [Firmicutes bacterium]|nr:hypothetical protein [Bacillota bacterium]